MHIFETAGWWGKTGASNWKEDNYQKRFYAIREQYRHLILLEVSGHDHLANLGFHAAPEGGFMLEKVLFPGLTASSNTQPGFGTFIYDEERQTLGSLKFTYLDVDATFDLPLTTTIDQLPWFVVDFAEDFGLEDLSGH